MDKEPIHVIVERDLQDLIPNFIQRRHDDLEKLREALATGDFETVRVIGHSMKGTGGGYGFDEISEFGAAIEKAAKDSASDDARFLKTILLAFRLLSISGCCSSATHSRAGLANGERVPAVSDPRLLPLDRGGPGRQAR